MAKNSVQEFLGDLNQFMYLKCLISDSQAGIKIARRNINNLSYAEDTILMAESEEELKSLLICMKESGKSWLKIQHSKN